MTDQTTYRIINLVSGDNIIGQLTKKEESSITVYRPFQMKIITMMDKAGPNNMFRQEALVMRNWLDLSEEEGVTIPMGQVITMTKPTNKVSELYDEEKEKEDNPSYMKELFESLQNLEQQDDEDGDDEEMPFSPEDIAKNMTIEIDPDDIREILRRIIENNDFDINNSGIDEVDEEYNNSDEDYHDTDKDMFGW